MIVADTIVAFDAKGLNCHAHLIGLIVAGLEIFFGTGESRIGEVGKGGDRSNERSATLLFFFGFFVVPLEFVLIVLN